MLLLGNTMDCYYTTFPQCTYYNGRTLLHSMLTDFRCRKNFFCSMTNQFEYNFIHNFLFIYEQKSKVTFFFHKLRKKNCVSLHRKSNAKAYLCYVCAVRHQIIAFIAQASFEKAIKTSTFNSLFGK